MNNNEFINKYTSGKCLSFIDFQVVAKKYGIYFEKINNDIIVCYDGDEDPKVAAFRFYKTFFPETTLTPSDFDLIIHLNNFHMKFLRDKINEISQKYGMPRPGASPSRSRRRPSPIQQKKLSPGCSDPYTQVSARCSDITSPMAEHGGGPGWTDQTRASVEGGAT